MRLTNKVRMRVSRWLLHLSLRAAGQNPQWFAGYVSPTFADPERFKAWIAAVGRLAETPKDGVFVIPLSLPGDDKRFVGVDGPVKLPRPWGAVA